MHINDVTRLYGRKDANVPPESFAIDLSQVQMTIYMGFVSFTIVVWDYMITFPDEFEYVWKGRKGIFVVLFLINRYLTPLGFIINLLACFPHRNSLYVTAMDQRDVSILRLGQQLGVSSSNDRCLHYVVYEGSTTVVGINIVALMMLIRIRALYGKCSWVIAFIGICFSMELGVNAWLLSHAVPVAHLPGIHACTMVFDESVGGIASAFAWSPLAYDTLIFALTIYKTIGPTRKNLAPASKIARVMLKDGTMYYSVILGVNLVLMIMLVAAPPGLQNICSQLSYLLTVTMMSRITLSLRKKARTHETDSLLRSDATWKSTASPLPRFALQSHAAIPSSTGLGNVSVTVQEHNDDTPISSADGSPKGPQEWHELQVRHP